MSNRATKAKTSARTNSRSGCASCKRKRLKCDETTPACVNCLKRKIECPGYQQTFKWPSKSQTNCQNFHIKTQKRIRPRNGQHQSGADDRPVSDEIVDSNRSCNDFDGENPSQYLLQDEGNSLESTRTYEIEETMIPERWKYPNQGDVEDVLAEASYELDTNALPIFDWDLAASEELFPRPLLPPAPCASGASEFETVQSPFENFIASQPFDWPSPNEFQSNRTLANKRTGIQRLLKGFYRVQHAVPLPLVHQETKLVEYYFSTISGIYSCFDSHLNPFRSVVGQMWTFSPSMYYTIQSMAAAHLANGIPSMRKLGMDLHHQASRHLNQELSTYCSLSSKNEQVLLVLLLIGLTASWHRAGDLGLPYLKIARSLMHMHPAFNEVGGWTAVGSLQQLFEEAMIYWEMMVSFVANETEVDIIPFDQLESETPSEPLPSLQPTDSTAETLPHPWTGISPQSQMLLAHVGRLVRRVRTLSSRLSLERVQTQYLPMALDLEENLLSTTPLPPSSPIESGDHLTKANDFVILAEATRDCGLLELYRTFPELLQRRLGATNTSDFFSSIIDIGYDDASLTSPSSNTTQSPPSSSNAKEQQRAWLTSFSLHILNRLESIPDWSNVRCHQLLLLIIPAAELRLPHHQQSNTPQPQYDISDQDLEISRARGFVRSRLNQLAVRLPAQPVHVMLTLLDEVWTRMDCASGMGDDVFWIDVMIEKGWHTIMG